MHLALTDRSLCRIAASVKDPGVQWVRLEELIPSEDLGTKDFDEVAEMQAQMEHAGAWPEKMPFVSVTPLDDGFLVLDGHHRCLAAEAAGIERIPVLIFFDEDHYEEFRSSKSAS